MNSAARVGEPCAVESSDARQQRMGGKNAFLLSLSAELSALSHPQHVGRSGVSAGLGRATAAAERRARRRARRIEEMHFAAPLLSPPASTTCALLCWLPGNLLIAINSEIFSAYGLLRTDRVVANVRICTFMHNVPTPNLPASGASTSLVIGPIGRFSGLIKAGPIEARLQFQGMHSNSARERTS